MRAPHADGGAGASAARTGPSWRAAAIFGGDARAALIAAVLTLVTVVPYAAVAAAPLGTEALAAAALSSLIAAMVGGTVAASLGPAAVHVHGPRASVCVVIAAAITALSRTTAPDALPGWIMLCLALAAVIQGALGWHRMGNVIRMIPQPVTTGFMVGISIELACAQIPHLLGAAGGKPVQAIALSVGMMTVGVAMAMLGRGAANAALPAGLMAGALMGGAATLFEIQPTLTHLQSVSFETLPLFLPTDAWSALQQVGNGEQIATVLGFAIAIALVNSIETLSAVTAIEETSHRRIDADRALLGSAIGSLVSGLFGGLPVAAGTAATMATHRDSASSSRVATIASGLLVAILALAGSPLLDLIPTAAVAGVLLVISAQLGLPRLLELWSQQQLATREHGRGIHADVTVASLVCVMVVLADIGVALVAGVLASAWLVVRQMRERLVSHVYMPGDRHPGACADEALAAWYTVPPRACVLELSQPVFFATVERLVEIIEHAARTTPCVILDATRSLVIDATAWRALGRCARTLDIEGHQLVLVTTDPRAKHSVCFDSVAHALRAKTQPTLGCRGSNDRRTRVLPAKMAGPAGRLILRRQRPSAAHSRRKFWSRRT